MTHPSPISGLAEKAREIVTCSLAGIAFASAEDLENQISFAAPQVEAVLRATQRAALESPLPVAAQGVDALHIVFDGPPDRDGGRFVEVETPDGRSVNIGEWHHRPDNLWELRIPSNVNLLRRAMDYLSDIYNPEDEALYRLRNDIEASLTKTAAPLGVEPTDEQVNLAAEVIWNDRDARMGGPWNLRNPDEVVVLQTKATARAVLKAAALPIPAPDAQAVAWRYRVDRWSEWYPTDKNYFDKLNEERNPNIETRALALATPVTGEADAVPPSIPAGGVREALEGSVDGDTPLQAAAREAGWALMELVDSIDWTKREQVAGIISRLGAALSLPAGGVAVSPAPEGVDCTCQPRNFSSNPSLHETGCPVGPAQALAALTSVGVPTAPETAGGVAVSEAQVELAEAAWDAEVKKGQHFKTRLRAALEAALSPEAKTGERS